MKTQIADVEASIKGLNKRAAGIERDLRTIADIEKRLPELQADVERIRKTVNIHDDAQLDALTRAREKVQICLDLRETNPPLLAEPVRNVISGLESLNDILRAAAHAEREQIIRDATAVLGHYAGTRQVDALNGAESNPAREIAETLPILDFVPSEASALFEVPTAENIEHRGFVQVAESVLAATRKAIAVAEAWLSAGGKFVTTGLK